ncbi:MAG: D-glycero-alpha-D-manno-heptose-1,7-bisphosphate 7-phosphatase [Candidatus Hydrogenedentota bacterium]
MTKAVFFDRDGTLIRHVHYLADPAEVALLPDSACSLRRLREKGYRAIVVTNQSALGRGLFTEADYRTVNEAMCRQLAAENAVIDAIYASPDVPQEGGRFSVEYRNRKPGPGMLEQAAADYGLDIAQCWMVGDMISDVLAGHNAGCKGSVLASTGNEGIPKELAELRPPVPVARTLTEAVDRILAE